MRQVLRNDGMRRASRWPFSFFAVVLALVISVTARAQGKTDPVPAACVPSDLNALIVMEGSIVQVNEGKEELSGKGRASRTTDASDLGAGGLDIQKTKEAYKVFSKEARAGNPAAMVNLAVSSLAGWGTKPNAGAALYWLHAAAERGYGAAYYDLGILYFKGCGVSQDMAEAFHYFDLGARGGYAPAQVNLGYFYDHGVAVAQDHTAAAHWYLQAAESGEAQAQYNLGDLYLHGEGVPRDESKAFSWFQKAALQGHTSGQIMVGSMFAAGHGTPKDLAGAYLWILAATLQGDERAVPTLRLLESQLTRVEIAEARERAQRLLSTPERPKASSRWKLAARSGPSH